MLPLNVQDWIHTGRVTRYVSATSNAGLGDMTQKASICVLTQLVTHVA